MHELQSRSGDSLCLGFVRSVERLWLITLDTCDEVVSVSLVNIQGVNTHGGKVLLQVLPPNTFQRSICSLECAL